MLPPFFDLHTHHASERSADSLLVESLRPSELKAEVTDTASPRAWISLGLHPWYSTDLSPASLNLLERALDRPSVVALGECGLDKCCTTALPLQIEYLRAQLLLASERGLPVILHLVRAWDELLRLRKELRPQVPWIIHGFRGKATQARQLLAQGFYLSFGERAHSEALLAAFQARRLFLETDLQPHSGIQALYALTAKHLALPLETLRLEIEETRKSVFPFL